MNKLFKEVQKEIKKVSLTNTEKEVMLSHILTHASPEERIGTIRQPSQKILSYSFTTLFMQPRAVAFVLLFSIITSTTATSAFAEKALPGDILYPVKTKITEPARGLLVTTQEAKVVWQERLTERRLTEAEEVINRGNLDQKTRELIERSVDTQIDTFTEAVTKLSDDTPQGEDKAMRASQATLRVEAVLLAHQEVLSGKHKKQQEEDPALMSVVVDIATTTLSTTEKKREARSSRKDERKLFADSLKKQESKVRYYRNQAESHVGVSTTSEKVTEVASSTFVMRTAKITSANDISLSRAVEDKKKSAEKVHASLKQSFEAIKDTLPEAIALEIQAKIDKEEQLLNDARTASTSSSYGQALALYQSAISSTNEIKILMLSRVIKKEIEDTRKDAKVNNSQKNSWQNTMKKTRDSFNDRQKGKTERSKDDREDR